MNSATPGSLEPPADQSEWWQEFDAAARRPLATRIRYAFIRTHKPVLDDAPTVRLTPWPTIAPGVKPASRTGSAITDPSLPP